MSCLCPSVLSVCLEVHWSSVVMWFCSLFVRWCSTPWHSVVPLPLPLPFLSSQPSQGVHKGAQALNEAVRTGPRCWNGHHKVFIHLHSHVEICSWKVFKHLSFHSYKRFNDKRLKWLFIYNQLFRVFWVRTPVTCTRGARKPYAWCRLYVK